MARRYRGPGIHGVGGLPVAALGGGGFGAATLTLTATTTAPGQTVTIHRMTPAAGKTLTIAWGDGNTTVVLAGDTTAKSNVYAAADTYKITVTTATDIVQIELHDSRLSGLKTAELAASAITYFVCYSLGAAETNVIDSADMAGWMPTAWYLYSMPSGSYTIDSADMASWTPNKWYLLSMPSGSYTIDSADMAGWKPTGWYLQSMPSGSYAIDSADMTSWLPSDWRLTSMPSGSYAIDSADMTSWSPSDWRLSSMPSGSYTIDSADMAAWRPGTWYLQTMPSGSYTIDSADMAAWTPGKWSLQAMPSGSYTIDSADTAAWRPNEWYLQSMPSGSYTIDSADMAGWAPTSWGLSSIAGGGAAWILTADDFAGWVSCTMFQIQDNGLTQAQVDAVLYGLYQATLSRTVTGGIIHVEGSNAAPSGTYQPCASCPVNATTPGKEVAHELLNDGCDAIAPGETWTSVTFTP